MAAVAASPSSRPGSGWNDGSENTQPQHYAVLIRDLEARTGLTIERVEVESVDLLRQRAVLRVYHR